VFRVYKTFQEFSDRLLGEQVLCRKVYGFNLLILKDLFIRN